MKDHYVKDYKEKELRQFILAYLLITVASIALHTDFSADNADLLDTLLKMAAMDIWVSGLSVLVVILNEIWPDAMKTKIVYGSMPSDTIFSEIAAGKRSFCFDLDAAKEKYKDLGWDTIATQQAIQVVCRAWNLISGQFDTSSD